MEGVVRRHISKPVCLNTCPNTCLNTCLLQTSIHMFIHMSKQMSQHMSQGDCWKERYVVTHLNTRLDATEPWFSFCRIRDLRKGRLVRSQA